MKNSKSFITISILTLLAATTTFGAETAKKGMPQMPPEMRLKMADTHQKMADCLRSDKPMSECHQEMMKSCHEAMGKNGCPMMGEMQGHMKGMMGKGMGGEAGTSSTAEHEKHHPSGQ